MTAHPLYRLELTEKCVFMKWMSPARSVPSP
eukprot:COSAG02_NODE_75542_length_144_cov_89.577778_1_plen_30_part_01